MILTDEELEIFELAYHLRLPLYQLMNEMPYDEFLGWIDYFKRRPIGWRDDNRASLIIMASGAKIKPTELFPSLKALTTANERSNNFEKSLKGSQMFQGMLNAVDGDKLDFLLETSHE